MAKLFNPPEHLPAPEPDYSNCDYDKEIAAEDAWLKKLAEFCVASGNGKLAGKIVRHGCGDGYAQYMVFSEKPFSLIHLPLGDAWSDDIWARGLRLSDARRLVDFSSKPLFGNSRVTPV